jgi:hypothetical protein
MESRSDSMDALNLANGFGTTGRASSTVATVDAAARRGCGRCASAGGAAATHDASTPALVRRMRRARRRMDVTECEFIEDGKAALEGGVPQLLCSAAMRPQRVTG